MWRNMQYLLLYYKLLLKLMVDFGGSQAEQSVAASQYISVEEYYNWRYSSDLYHITWIAATPVSSTAPVSSAMLPIITLVPVAVCAEVRTISYVAAPCPSMAAAIAPDTALILRMRLPIALIA